METKNNCLKSGQATVCLEEKGVLFSVNYLFTKKEKLIPYNNIKEVLFGPKWLIFPGFRILEKGDSYLYVEFREYTGFNFKHNQISVPFWKYKEWENLVNLIRQKIK